MRILTGIQSTGIPHLGNILGIIINSVKLSYYSNNSLFFIADLHSLINIKDSDQRDRYVFSIASAWLALGLNFEKSIFYRQSKIPEVCELNWYLNCFSSYSLLSNSHAFKEKILKKNYINTGLLTYPILMASDILLYDSQYVLVGRDQLQHLEIINYIVKEINKKYGNIFITPKPIFNFNNFLVPGIDGRKMSKSYNNVINIFLSDDLLMKDIMSIKTNSILFKDPDNCFIFNIYKLLSDNYCTEKMRRKYLSGNFNYFQIKKDFFELIIYTFSKERQLYKDYMNDLSFIKKKLEYGEILARNIARKTLLRIKNRIGY